MVDTIPYEPDWARPLTVSKRVLSSTAVSGKNKSRTKVGAKKTFELMFQNRDETEFLAALSFWDSHYPDVNVYYNDKSLSTPANVTVRIVSDFVDNSSGGINDRSYSFVVEEA